MNGRCMLSPIALYAGLSTSNQMQMCVYVKVCMDVHRYAYN